MMAESVFSPKEALPAPMTVMVVGIDIWFPFEKIAYGLF
jgi:hypothetical protein